MAQLVQAYNKTVPCDDKLYLIIKQSLFSTDLVTFQWSYSLHISYKTFKETIFDIAVKDVPQLQWAKESTVIFCQEK